MCIRDRSYFMMKDLTIRSKVNYLEEKKKSNVDLSNSVLYNHIDEEDDIFDKKFIERVAYRRTRSLLIENDAEFKDLQMTTSELKSALSSIANKTEILMGVRRRSCASKAVSGGLVVKEERLNPPILPIPKKNKNNKTPMNSSRMRSLIMQKRTQITDMKEIINPETVNIVAGEVLKLSANPTNGSTKKKLDSKTRISQANLYQKNLGGSKHGKILTSNLNESEKSSSLASPGSDIKGFTPLRIGSNDKSRLSSKGEITEGTHEVQSSRTQRSLQVFISAIPSDTNLRRQKNTILVQRALLRWRQLNSSHQARAIKT
eukprot:TRINITY_DN7325_c0_g1_i9.p2 TRINITY_DN7325_c0_g1~~TRINITY_DN7325_c0_g1_i9.p2  ORF type:complete len:317 (-),score=26.15 TRINITY_DN7325_c0_g1_i9:1247-2197(-)